MIDIFDLQVTNFNRNDYFHLASRAFADVRSRGAFPIVIGGTNYYIETLLFQQKIAENRITDLSDPNASILAMQKKEEEAGGVATDPSVPTKEGEELKVEKTIQAMTLKEKHDKLRELDPLMANKLHPNEERRISSYLKQAMMTGSSPSEVMDDHEHVPLREKASLIFWPRCKSKEKLDA